MFKSSTIFVFIFGLIAVGLMIEETVAGDCSGQVCGCYKGYCWAYVDARSTNPGDWWCYTQLKDIVGKRSLWQRCDRDGDCFWDRTCGNCRQYRRQEEQLREIC